MTNNVAKQPREIKACAVDFRRIPRSGRSCGKNFRSRVLEAFSHRCEYCGCAIGMRHDPRQWASVDRIIPRKQGGLYVPGNVTASCLLCNAMKGEADFIGPVRTLVIMEACRG